MSVIDERIVDMQFNNKQFETGVKDTLSSLDSLKTGLSGIDDAGKKFSLAGIAEGVTTIADKFSALGIIGITALQNITNMALDAGKKILSALTIEPLTDGFREYELQMNAVKVMMANLGDKTTMAQVNSALDDLNAYADKTIYNFGNMTDAVGKFTAAGVGLEDSTMAIKGLSNIAAGAGVPAYKMANAYIQVSQALQAGTFRLQDWNSLQNAGLANEEFRNRLVKNAEAIDGFTLGNNNFRESLKDGWLTTEVFLATMSEAADETDSWGKRLYAAATEVTTFSQMIGTLKEAIGTGWGDSLKIIIGDFEEAKELWTSVSGVLDELVGSFADARNETLRFWKENSGRDMLIESISNAFKGLQTILAPINEAWSEIFPPMTGERLVQMTKNLLDLSEKFKISDETAANLKSTFAGLFAAFDLVRMGISAVFQVAGDLLSRLIPMGSGVLGVTASLGDFIVRLRDAAIDGDVFGKGVEKVGEVLDKVQEVIQKAANGIKSGIDKLKTYFQGFSGINLGPLLDFGKQVEIVFAPFTFIASVFKKAWEGMVSVFQWAAPIVGPIAIKIGQAFSDFGQKIGDAVKSGDLKSLLDLVNTGLLGGLIVGLKKFIESMSDITKGAGGFLEGLTSVLDGVRGSLEAYQSKLKAQTLLTIAGAIALLAGSLLVLSTIDADDMGSSLAAITVLFVELAATMLVLSKNMGSVKMGAIAAQMVIISAAILILSVAMKSLSGLDWDELAKGGAGVAALSIILVKAADGLSKNSGKLISGGVGLIAFSAAIIILTSAVEKLGKLDIETLAKGLGSVGVLMAEVAGFTNIVKPDKLLSTGIAMSAMAASLIIMAIAVEKFGNIDIETLVKGLGSVAAILLSIGAFSQLVKPEKLLSTSIAMIAIGAALNIIAIAVESLGSLSWEQLAKGLASIGAALVALALFTQIVNPSQIMATSVAMVIMGAALLIISQAIQSFGSMSWEEIAKGLTVLAAALLVIALAVNAMSGAIVGAAAMLVMSAAIMMLVPAIMLLGSMDLIEIGKALLALVGVFAVVGVAGLVLGPLTPVILALSVAIALLGVGALAVGAGLLAFSAGLAALAVSGAAGAAALVLAVTAIVGLIPMTVAALGEGLLLFVQVIADGIPIIMTALTALVMGLIQVLVDLAPNLVEAVFVFVGAMLKALLDHLPQMVDTGMKLLIGLLEGIAKNIQQVVATSLLIMAEFLRGIAEGIPGVASAGVDIIVAFIRAIGIETPRIIDAGFKMIIDFVNGLAKAIRENTAPLVEAFGNLASAMIEGLVGGIFAGAKGAIDAITTLGSSLINGFKKVLGINSPSKVFTNLAGSVGDGFVKGLSNSSKGAVEAIKGLGNSVIIGFQNVMDIHSPSGVFEEMGEDTVDGYNKGVENKTEDAEAQVKKLADAAINKAYESFDVKAGKSNIFEQLGITNAESFITGLNAMGGAIKESLKKVFSTDEETLKTITGTLDEALKTIESRLTSYTELATDRFSRISTESEISVEEMITNLKHNQMAIAEWADNIAKLAERGLNEGLLEQLRQAGPKSAGEVKALVAASDVEIQQLNTVMARGGQVATQALATSVGMGAPLMIEPGQSLVAAVSQGLTSSTTMNEAMSMLITAAKQSGLNQITVAGFDAIGNNVPDEIGKGISSNTGSVKSSIDKMGTEAGTSANSAGKNIVSEAEKGLQTNSGTFKETGTKFGNDFASALTNTQTPASTAGKTVATAAETGLKTISAVFGQTGTKFGNDFSNALSNTQTAAGIAARALTTAAEMGLKTNSLVFGQTGTKYGEDFASGLSNKQTAAKTAGTAIAKAAEEGVKSLVAEIEKAGIAFGEGFIKGIASMVDEAAEVARSLAAAAQNAIEDELDIQSPSKELYADGRYAGLGFVNGLLSMVNRTANAGAEISSSALSGIKEAISNIGDVINDDMNLTPTITPVLDLTNIQNGSESIRRMLSGSQVTTPIANNVNRISTQMAGTPTSETPAPRQTPAETKFEFTQNNYSPRALTRLEIYRQTKNQFAQLKEVVERT